MSSEAAALRALGRKIQAVKERDFVEGVRAHLAMPIGRRVEAAVLLAEQYLAAFPLTVSLPDDEADVIACVQRRLAGRS